MSHTKEEVLALINTIKIGAHKSGKFDSSRITDMLAEYAAMLGTETVAYLCSKERDRWGSDDKPTGEKWLEQKVTMDHEEAHML